jgi:hypothetical protein
MWRWRLAKRRSESDGYSRMDTLHCFRDAIPVTTGTSVDLLRPRYMTDVTGFTLTEGLASRSISVSGEGGVSARA